MSIAYRKYKIVMLFLNKSIFNENIVENILDYYWNIVDNKKLILLDWININNLDWYNLSQNPNAIDLLLENKNKINWLSIMRNPNAIKLFNTTNINWSILSENPNAIDILKKI